MDVECGYYMCVDISVYLDNEISIYLFSYHIQHCRGLEHTPELVTGTGKDSLH